ncbi:unnamed protein product [Arabidopsis lyrata]|nr:unnamed protein product [Arabidopsis lyrata]
MSVLSGLMWFAPCLYVYRSDRDLICSMDSFEAFYNRVPSISPYPGVQL